MVIISSFFYRKYGNKNDLKNTIISLVFSSAFFGFYVRDLFVSVVGYKIILLVAFSLYIIWLILKVLKAKSLK